MGYLIKPQTDQIVTAKVTLTSADLLTPGLIYDIPEYPAIADYFWNVIYMIGFVRDVNSPPTVYVGTSQIHIQTNSAPILQFRLQATIMQFTAVSTPGTIQSGFLLQQYLPNQNLQVHNPGTLTFGDTELDIYIGAKLIKY
jgi:hypothetical protein